MPLQLLILCAVLAVPAASFADDLAQKGSPAPAAAPKVLPPRIINIPQVSQDEEEDVYVPVHKTADRDLLLRQFPDDLVESMWLQDWQDIERAYQVGRLVDVPSDPDGRGIVLRLEGESRIGELEDDPYYQTLMCRLTKPAAGLLYRIAARLRLMEGNDYEPLQVTSLVRTWDYQVRLTSVNPNADRTRDGIPPTHVLGVAFDIARSRMSQERQQRVEFLFDELVRDGELAYYKEGSHNGLAHYHVIALPSANLALERDYERVPRYEREPGFLRAPRFEREPKYEREGEMIDQQEAAAAALPRHHYLPEAPCVTFGSSLEPFSSICSCELPLEVAANALGDAPVSH